MALSLMPWYVWVLGPPELVLGYLVTWPAFWRWIWRSHVRRRDERLRSGWPYSAPVRPGPLIDHHTSGIAAMHNTSARLAGSVQSVQDLLFGSAHDRAMQQWRTMNVVPPHMIGEMEMDGFRFGPVLRHTGEEAPIL